MKLEITHWSDVKSPAGKRLRTSMEKLAEWLAKPREVIEKTSLAGWSPTTFSDDYRKLSGVEKCYALVLDYDGKASADDIDLTWGGSYYILHSTHSHSDRYPSFRVVLPFHSPATLLSYYATWRWAHSIDPLVDVQCKDPSRLWFSPGHKPGSVPYVCEVHAGKLIEVRPESEAQPAPIAAPVPTQKVSAPTSVMDRARKYLQRVDIAIEGQGGSTRTFLTAQRLVRGFNLNEEDAYCLLAEWNLKCKPPWSEKDLRRKVSEASRAGTMRPDSLRLAK